MEKPKLFVLNLTCEDDEKNTHLYVYVCVALNRSEAYFKALDTIKNKTPEYYNIGMQTKNGIEVASCDALSERQVMNLFQSYNKLRPPDNLFVGEITEKPTEKPEDEKTKLMKSIIENKDKELFEKNIDTFSIYEKLYIEDSIK